MSSPIRVAWVFDWFAYYSAGVLAALAPECKLAVLTRDHGLEIGAGARAPEAKRALFRGVENVTLLAGRQSDPRSLFRVAGARRFLRAFRPDVVHVQDHFDWRLEWAARLPGVPVVLTVHDVVPHPGWADPRTSGQRAVERRIRETAHVICVHGETNADLLREQSWYRGQPIVSLPLGALAHAVAPRPFPAEPTVLFFGRLEHYKGLDIFVQAVEIAARTVPGLRAIIAGQGAAETLGREMMRSPSLFDWRVGFVPDDAIEALFGESSLVVLPYREASQSGVVPLAFSAGRPVIATDVGALSQAITHGDDGLLVPAGDPAALADAMVRVLGNPMLLEHLASGARAALEGEKLSPHSVAAAHLRAYDLALAKGASAR